ncbi:hypothetical protein SSX86_015780 [Deinandra increscens subsp. villosa]|uniref:Cell wall protein n=1 Tax=Deinandra increscens subsp. villosa TaxID=3103831 RepID=A0AAP0D114_9ASTR
MAKNLHLFTTLILIFHILIFTAVSGRDIANTNLEKREVVKQPESLIDHDRSYLIPGVGRGIKPKFTDGFNPFTYNPVTGGNDGGILGGHRVPRVGGVGGRSFLPGGDDTFVPNPGFEVPVPGTGTATPVPVHN